MSGGSVVILDSNISQNYGGEGGGLALYGAGRLSLTNSALLWNYSHRPNSASGGGGAISTFTDNVVEITNCTLVGNSTTWDGGSIANGGSMTITNSTLAYNGAKSGAGTIENSGRLVLRNSIIANSLAGPNCRGELIDGGGNLRWPDTDSSCIGDFGDPRLKPLALNDGTTLNMAIDIASAAFQHASANCPATDQRGLPRARQPGYCDSGAFELQDLLGFLPLISR
jgi:hypothetical protein